MDTTLQGTSRRRLEFDQDEDQGNPSVDDETIEQLHSKISKEVIPRIGMEFETEDAAYEFYNAYALRVGFSIRKCSLHRQNGKLLDRRFVCSCQGQRRSDKRDNVYKSHRAETRFGCPALLSISCRQTGKYRVFKFIAKHSHSLASPRKAHLYRSHRNISLPQGAEVELADSSGIAPKNGYEFMARKAGGREILGFTNVDYKNYLQSKRTSKMDPREAGGILEYLQDMKVEDPSFFYAIQVDKDALITNIFWADATMMADYEDFGDVICFDTTYRKHKDGRPIALFVGVNHHKQSTIFGAALLYDETAETFVWLFDTFSRAMGGKLPKTILTDQDAAMSKALAFQWPKTYHRLCIWHIFQNAATHLHGVFSRYKDFQKDFSNCIYDYEYEEDFLVAWREMLDKYEQHNNDWLKRLFNIKEKWALVYGRDTFCADMTTTQRSESMNSMIKKYVSPQHDLRRFFEHFQRLLEERRYDEMVADFKATQSKISLSFPVAILEHAASVYTPKVFQLFQKEVSTCYDSHLEVWGEMGALLKYTITPHKKKCGFIVSYDITEGTICCNCRKFEFAGILCSHILKVFQVRGITEVPDKYILKRWTKNAKRGSIRATSQNSSVDVDPKTKLCMRYRELCRLSTHLVTRAAESEKGYNFVKEALLNLSRELDSCLMESPTQSSLQNYHVARSDPKSDMPLNVDCMTEAPKGLKVKPKPRDPSSKRPKSALDTTKKKRKRSKHSTSLNDPLCLTGNHREQHRVSSHDVQKGTIKGAKMNITNLHDTPMLRSQLQSSEDNAEQLRERCLKYYKGCHKYTPLDLCDMTSSSPDIFSGSYQSPHNSSLPLPNQASGQPMLPSPSNNSSLQVPPGSNMASSSAQDIPARDGRHGMSRANLPIDEQQRIQQYDQLLSSRNIQQPNMYVPGTFSGNDLGGRILPGGNGLSIPRLGNMVGTPSSLNMQPGAGVGQGISMLRPRDASMMRVSHGNNRGVSSFLTFGPTFPTQHLMHQQHLIHQQHSNALSNSHHPHLQGSPHSGSATEQQTFARDRQLQQHMLKRQQQKQQHQQFPTQQHQQFPTQSQATASQPVSLSPLSPSSPVPI